MISAIHYNAVDTPMMTRIAAIVKAAPQIGRIWLRDDLYRELEWDVLLLRGSHIEPNFGISVRGVPVRRLSERA